MKLKSTFIILLMMISVTACKKEKVGGACKYVPVSKNVSVTFIDGELNGEFMVSFQPIGAETDEVYRMTHKQFKNVLRNFDLTALQNKENTFKLMIDEITQGACTPFTIKEVHLE